jgi:predicted DNA-binding antitoxin AbrB/MazE fold protein
MQGLEIEAAYENGTLKLPRELPLQEGQRVTLTITPTRASSSSFRGGGSMKSAPTASGSFRLLTNTCRGQWTYRGNLVS